MEFLTNGFNVLLIIIGFGLLIFIHELGHFIAAKWAGIRTEGFAVGMGPVAVAWRKGIGLRFGSTDRALSERVQKYFESSGINVDLKGGNELERGRHIRRAMDAMAIGETEYSLRWLPIGGFVKMLGQEDANPNAVSDDPRSYTRCPVGKRMIVVSAGVIMNIILALILFVIAFMVGVRFEAPVVGEVAPHLAAGRAHAINAQELGIAQPGLLPGDQVIEIDGKPARTFADLQIASAMSRTDIPVKFVVRREGIEQPLQFSLTPEKDATTGLRSIGIMPGASSTLEGREELEFIRRMLTRAGLSQAGVEPGMRLSEINGRPVSAFGQISRAAQQSQGQPLQTVWNEVNAQGESVGNPVHASLRIMPQYMSFRQLNAAGDEGLLGLAPLTKVVEVAADSPNRDILKVGDIITRIGDVDFPRPSQIFEQLGAHKKQKLSVHVLRDGLEQTLQCEVTRRGELKIGIAPAEDTLVTAQPIASHKVLEQGGALNESSIQERATSIAPANLMTTGGTRVLAVNDEQVATWPEFRAALLNATASAFEASEASPIELHIEHPNRERDRETLHLTVAAEDVQQLHALSWRTELSSNIFEPIQVTLSADSNPFRAIAMGMAETKKLVILTYLTIDRLVRGTVGVDQLRGPVGIIHIGSKVADRGFMYMIFFLGMISVNLAVINFLPMPIVDGGLFLFLVYEKFKGRPPSLAFQNVATIVGLCIIGTLFLVTFYNDVLRLFS